MNDTVINVKTTSETKEGAQRVAESLGFSLSSLVNAYLKKLVRTKKISFSLQEEVTPHFKESLKKSNNNVKNGEVSPEFDDPNHAGDWLKKSKP